MVWIQRSFRTPEKHEGWSCYQNSTGADSPRSALETEGHVPKAKHIDLIKLCLIRDDLHMTAHLRSKGHLFTPALKEIRWTRAKCLLQWHAENGHKNILFTDEKIFTIDEQYNNQYNKIYNQKSLEVHSESAWGHHLSYVMVWCGVSHHGATPLHFCEKGVKTGARVYQEDMLLGVVKPLNATVFSGQKWVFQQDSAPAHKAKTIQEWLRRNAPGFVRAED